MRESWSINALSEATGADRRTLSRWIARANLTPAADGPRGPQFALRDVIGVLSDANLLGDPERRAAWHRSYAAEWSSRDLAKRVLRALAARLDEPALRTAREVLGQELLAALERSDRESFGERSQRGALPGGGWPAMSDRELARRLRLLVEIGRLEELA